MFSQLRQGSTVWVLDKNGEEPELRLGQITNAPQVQPKYNMQNPAMNGFQAELVVDLTIKAGEKEYDLKRMPAGQNIETRDDIKAVISDSQEAMLQEVEAMSVHSQQIVDSAPYHEKVLVCCEKFRRMLNPRYEKEQQRDEAIDQLNKRFDALEARIGTALDRMLSK